MKLLPLLLLICLDCGAQTGSRNVPVDSVGTLSAPVSDRFDTVRVMLLYCDTAKWQKKYTIYFDSKADTAKSVEWLEADNQTYWQFGYEVRENEPPIFYYDQAMTPKFATPFRHVSYLDDRRRPLSKSIIVWQSIKL